MKKVLIIFALLFCTFSMFSQTKNALDKIKNIYKKGDVINYFAGDNDEGYFLGYDGGKSYAYNSSSGATTYVKKIYNQNGSIKSMAFTPKGEGWVIIYDKNRAWWNNIPYSLEKKIKELNKNGNEINFVQFANTGGWILFYDGGYSFSYKDFPSEAGDAVSKRQKQGKRLKSISFTPSGGWVLIYGHNGWQSSNAHENCTNRLNQINNKKNEILSTVFTEFNEYVIIHEEGVSYNFMSNYQVDSYKNTLTEYASWSYLDIENLALNDGTVLLPCMNIKGDNILTIESAHIRSNGEHPMRDPAILGIDILFSNNAKDWYYCYNIPLIGLHNEGAQAKGGCKGYAKLEWNDNEAIKYYNYGILDWDAWANYKYIRFRITEGDHEHDPKWAVPKNMIKYSPLRWVPGVRSSLKNDIVFDMYDYTEELKSGMTVKIRGNESNHATLWLKTKRRN